MHLLKTNKLYYTKFKHASTRTINQQTQASAVGKPQSVYTNKFKNINDYKKTILENNM